MRGCKAGKALPVHVVNMSESQIAQEVDESHNVDLSELTNELRKIRTLTKQQLAVSKKILRELERFNRTRPGRR